MENPHIKSIFFCCTNSYFSFIFQIKYNKCYNASEPLPPLVVRQHAEPPRKYIVLTAQGAHILLKLRPVDILRQLLIDSNGPDGEAVKAFFMLQKEDQACATSLILASLEGIQNSDVAEWATRAFFMFGGEPQLLPHIDFNQTPNCEYFTNRCLFLVLILFLCLTYNTFKFKSHPCLEFNKNTCKNNN